MIEYEDEYGLTDAGFLAKLGVDAPDEPNKDD